MTIIHRSATVPYSPAQMFELVNTIEDYSKFVPWCVGSHVLSRNEDEVHAELDFARSGFHKAFTTHNRLQKDKMIEIRLIEGPFKHLEGFWRFDHENGGCIISLDLEFEFSNKLLSLAFGPLFNQVANRLVEVFCTRAREIHGGQ